MRLKEFDFNYKSDVNVTTGQLLEVGQSFQPTNYADLDYIGSTNTYFIPVGNGSVNYFIPQAHYARPMSFDEYWMDQFRKVDGCRSDSLLFECFVGYCKGEVIYRRDSFGAQTIVHQVIKALFTLE